MYALAEPLSRSVTRLYGVFSVDHVKMGRLLEEQLASLDDDDVRRLPLQRLLFKALQYAGDARANRHFLRFVSDRIDAAQKMYNEREYERAAIIAEAALEDRPDIIELREIYSRTLIQLERYDLAESQAERVRELGRASTAEFLLGFLYRKRGRHRLAIGHYRRALDLGRKGVAIHRELAQCYFELDELDKAREHIAEAEERDAENRFVVDLKCQIATRLRYEAEAYNALAVLEYIDRKDFYFHRKSTVEYAFGRREQALRDVATVFELCNKPSFEMYSQLVNVLIGTEEYEDARYRLDQMDNIFRGRRRDIRLGLRCKLLIAQGKLEDALRVWNEIEQKEHPAHVALRYQALKVMTRGQNAERAVCDEIRVIESTYGVVRLERMLDEWYDDRS